MPTPTVKSPQTAAGRWKRRAQSASGEYEQGVRDTTADWAAAASAAKAAYVAGVQEANARDAFSKGVQGAGNAKWKDRALKKGPQRFSEGVTIAEDDYSRGVAPFLEVASRTDLPMRGAVGSEQNYQRSVTMAKAMRAAKTRR